MSTSSTAEISPPLPARGEAAPAGPVTGAVVVLGTAAALAWCYAPTLATMMDRWSRDPQYSHGFLVPVFALVILWSRRSLLAKARWRPSLLGVPLVAAGMGLRLAAAVADVEPLDALSLLPTIAGLVLMVGGWGFFRASWPSIAFLGFMLPLPFVVETAMAYPLRRLATVASTYVLQTCGCPAIAEGNLIHINEIPLGVEDACNGLGMLVTFFALSTLLAIVVDMPWFDRVVLVLSAMPIALIANTARIAGTGLAYHHWGRDSEAAQAILHDLAGWLMMPLALLLLWLELKYLQNLFVVEAERKPLPLFKAKTPGLPGLAAVATQAAEPARKSQETPR
jgi:exosortase